MMNFENIKSFWMTKKMMISEDWMMNDEFRGMKKMMISEDWMM